MPGDVIRPVISKDQLLSAARPGRAERGIAAAGPEHSRPQATWKAATRFRALHAFNRSSTCTLSYLYQRHTPHPDDLNW